MTDQWSANADAQRRRVKAAEAECDRLRAALEADLHSFADIESSGANGESSDCERIAENAAERVCTALAADQQSERDPYPVGPPDKLPADGHARRLRPTDDQQGEGKDEGTTP